MRIGTWNIKSLYNRDQEPMKELKDHKINICTIKETKKKGRGPIWLLSGVPQNTRAQEGLAFLLHGK